MWLQVAKLMENKFAERNLGVLVNTKLTMTMIKHCAFTATKCSSLLGGGPFAQLSIDIHLEFTAQYWTPST